MSREEFERWWHHYQDQPFDDLHRYQRPAAWLAMSMNGVEPRDSLKWLSGKRLSEASNDSDTTTLAAFGLVRPKG